MRSVFGQNFRPELLESVFPMIPYNRLVTHWNDHNAKRKIDGTNPFKIFINTMSSNREHPSDLFAR